MLKQDFFYNTLRGKLVGSNERERAVLGILGNIKQGESFLDVGCASGYYLGKFVGRCGRCAGIDCDEEDINAGREMLPKAELHCGDATSLNKFKDNEFDWVLCSEVLEHIPKWKKALGEIKRVCKRNAVLTIPVENGVFWRSASVFIGPKEKRGHVHALSSGEIEENMQGFGLVKKQYVHTPFTCLNKRLSHKKNEKYAMYSVLWFRKKGKAESGKAKKARQKRKAKKNR